MADAPLGSPQNPTPLEDEPLMQRCEFTLLRRGEVEESGDTHWVPWDGGPDRVLSAPILGADDVREFFWSSQEYLKGEPKPGEALLQCGVYVKEVDQTISFRDFLLCGLNVMAEHVAATAEQIANENN